MAEQAAACDQPLGATESLFREVPSASQITVFIRVLGLQLPKQGRV
jgi:hypothetical protein